MTYYSEMGKHHFVRMDENLPADTSPGNSFSLLVSVPTGWPTSTTATIDIECAPEDPANPGNPDNTAWAPLMVKQEPCDPNSPMVPAQITVTQAHAGRVIEAALDLCGCRFVRARITYAGGPVPVPGATMIGMFGHLRRAEPPA